MSPSRRTKRDHWPPSGPHRRLLEHLDRVREDAGRPTYSQIAREAHLAVSRISEFLTGAAMPSETNVELVVRGMGGGKDDVDTGRRLRAKCHSGWTPNDPSASLLKAIQRTDVLWRDLGLQEFTGRTELIVGILRFIDSRPRGYVVVRAEAGIGKTALAAHLVNEYGFIYHFTTVGNGRSVPNAFRNLCAQLISRYGVLGSGTTAGALPPDATSFEGFWHVLSSALVARSSDKPIVIVIDGMDEFEFPSASTSLGLPATLPDGVFVIITSRFGGEGRLTELRTPSEWLTIEVESSGNISDMRYYIDRVTDPVRGDSQLLERIAGTDIARLRHTLVARCAGVWIYLKYVLDEIRDGARTADDVGRLPADLGSYYAHNIMIWRGDMQDSLATDKWRMITLPVIATLAAIREPLSAKEIAHLANVDLSQAAAFLTATARAFLNRNLVDGTTLYSIRHESFRNLLRRDESTISVPAMSLLADDLQNAVAAADARFVDALAPSGMPADRVRHEYSPYAKRHLAHHAAACGRLDALLADASFLTSGSAESILISSTGIRTEAGRLAVRALFLSVQDWDRATTDERLCFVNMWATRLGAHAVAASASKLLNRRWRISASSAEWPGKRRLSKRQTTALDIRRVDGHTIIASGYWDTGVSVFDAATGTETDYYSGSPGRHSGWVSGIRIFHVDDRAVLVACWIRTSTGTSLRAWDLMTRETLWSVENAGGVAALDSAEVGGRVVLVCVCDISSFDYGDADGMVVRDLDTGEMLSSIRLERWGGHLGVAEIDGRNIVALSGVGIFELDTSFRFAKILESEEPWLAEGGPLAFDESPGLLTLVVGVDNCLEFVDPLTGRMTGEPLVVGDDGTSVADLRIGSIGERKVASVGTLTVSSKVEASLWDINARRKLDTSGREYGEDVTVAVCERESGSIAAFGSHDGLQVWEPRMGEAVGPADSPSPVHYVNFTHIEGRKVVVAGAGDIDNFGCVTMYDVQTKELVVPPIEWHDGPVYAASICSLDGQSVIMAGGWRGARMWNLHTGELLADITDSEVGHISAVDIVPIEGEHLAVVVNNEGIIFAFVVSPYGSLRRFYEVSAPSSGELSGGLGLGSVRDRRVAVISDENDMLRMYDLVSGEQVGIPVRGAKRTWGIAIRDVNGRCLVVSCGGGGEVRRSDPLSGDVDGYSLKKIDSEPLFAVTAGYLGGHAVTVAGGMSGLLTVWDAMTGRHLETGLRGHRGDIYAVTMDDAGRLVSGGQDGVLTWWDPAPWVIQM